MVNHSISTEFPFESKKIDVLGSSMRYIDEGEGDSILFLHGIPTSSYLWRNIIPHLKDHARCIAVDLIGLGKSDKPDIQYTVFDHIRYVEAFIDALSLENMTFMLHAWGSLIGFDIAMRRQNQMKALAFLEAHVRPTLDPGMVALPLDEITHVLNAPDGGYDVIMNSNYYVNKVLPAGVLRELTQDEMDHYREPFLKSGSSAPIWQFLQEVPLGDSDGPVFDLVKNYSKKLQKSPLPKLMFYAIPGFNTTVESVAWSKEHLSNLTLVEVEDALHYAQESKPDLIGQALSEWVKEISEAKASGEPV